MLVTSATVTGISREVLFNSLHKELKKMGESNVYI